MTTKKKNYSTFGPEELTRYLKKKRGPITFGRLLESHRKCEGWTQEELGKKIGVSKSKICDFEKGREIPSVKKAYEMALVFGVYEPLWVQYALQDQFRKQKIKLKVSVAA